MLEHVPKNKRTYEICKIAVQQTKYAKYAIYKHIPTEMKTRELLDIIAKRKANILSN